MLSKQGSANSFNTQYSLFEKIVIPYASTIVKRSLRKDLLVEIIQTHIASVFSRNDLNDETRQKFKDLLKDGIIETFKDDENAPGSFKLGPKLSQQSQEVLVTFWTTLAENYQSREEY